MNFEFKNIWSIVEQCVTTAAIFSVIRTLEVTNIIKSNDGNQSKVLFLSGILASTAVKLLNKSSINDNTKNFVDFTADVIALPTISNLWTFQATPLGYGLYLGVVIGLLPGHISKFTSNFADFLYKNLVNDSQLTDMRYDADPVDNTHLISVFRGFIPAFVRGVVFFELNQVTKNPPLSALISGSIMGYMLDNTSDNNYTFTWNVFVSGLNAASNRVAHCKVSTFMDYFIDGYSTFVAMEFVEYFLKNLHLKVHPHDVTSKPTPKTISVNNTINTTCDTDCDINNNIYNDTANKSDEL